MKIEDLFKNVKPATSQYIVNNLYEIDYSKVKSGDIVFDILTDKSYMFDKNLKPFQVSGNHGELDYIKSNPDKIAHIFEDKLKTIEYVQDDKNEYIQKLRKLKDDLDLIIINWV